MAKTGTQNEPTPGSRFVLLLVTAVSFPVIFIVRHTEYGYEVFN